MNLITLKHIQVPQYNNPYGDKYKTDKDFCLGDIIKVGKDKYLVTNIEDMETASQEGIMKLCNFTPGIFAEQETKGAATMSLISQLEDLSHRMRVLYTEVPQSDVLLLEDVIKVLKET